MYKSEIFYPTLLNKDSLKKLHNWQLIAAAYHFTLEIDTYENVGYVMTKENQHSPNIIQTCINGKLSTSKEFAESKTKEEKMDSMIHLRVEQQKLVNILNRNLPDGLYKQFKTMICEKLPIYKITRAKFICENFK
jgi:hypothetical protein